MTQYYSQAEILEFEEAEKLIDSGKVSQRGYFEGREALRSKFRRWKETKDQNAQDESSAVPSVPVTDEQLDEKLRGEIYQNLHRPEWARMALKYLSLTMPKFKEDIDKRVTEDDFTTALDNAINYGRARIAESRGDLGTSQK